MAFTAVDDEPVTETQLSTMSPRQTRLRNFSKESDSQVSEPQDFVILHVQMPEGLTMAGSRLLPAVLSLGFKYSDEGFFNRHLEPSKWPCACLG